MERKQRIQNLLDRLDVLEGRSSKKTRIQGLLSRLDTLTREKEDKESRKAEINKTIAKNPQVRGLFARLRSARQENLRSISRASQGFREETQGLRQELLRMRDKDTGTTESQISLLGAKLDALEVLLSEAESTFETKDALLEGEIDSLRQALAALPDFGRFATQGSVQGLQEALDDLERRIGSRISNIQRGGGAMNRQILVNGNQSTLGLFNDINLIPGSNMGIAVSVDQTNKRTNFTLYSSDLDRSAVWGSITGTLSNQTDLQTALDTKLSSVLTDGTLIQTPGPHLSRASIAGDISIPQGSVIATLPNVNADVGTFGDSVTVSRVTVNAKGQVTAASNVGIAFPTTSPAGANTQVQYNNNGAFGASSALAWDNNGSVLSTPILSSSSLVSGVQARFTGVGTFGTASLVTSNNTKLFVEGSATVGVDEWFRVLNASGTAVGIVSLDSGTGDVKLSANPNVNFLFVRSGTNELARLESSTGRFGLGITPTSRLHLGGSFAVPLNVQTSVYTMGANDHTLLANASVAGFTVNLPNASTVSGRIYAIKKTDVTSNAVTVDGNGTQTIDGTTTASIVTQYQSLIIQSDGANWHVLSSHK